LKYKIKILSNNIKWKKCYTIGKKVKKKIFYPKDIKNVIEKVENAFVLTANVKK